MSRRAGAMALSVLAIAGIGAASAETVQRGDLRVTALAQIQPHKLPRTEAAPIAVFVAGRLATRSGEVPPQLLRMTVRVNRNGVLRPRGLPACPLASINTATTERAFSRCGDALVGSGRFWATVVFPDQRPYPTRGRLLIFNGNRRGKPVLLAHIFTRSPFATSFVILFAIRRIDSGPYGTELVSSLPRALGSWGFVDRIKLTLSREYRYQGRQFSYLNASCAAPAGARSTAFPLARVGFHFAAQRQVSLSVVKSCGVKE